MAWFSIPGSTGRWIWLLCCWLRGDCCISFLTASAMQMKMKTMTNTRMMVPWVPPKMLSLLALRWLSLVVLSSNIVFGKKRLFLTHKLQNVHLIEITADNEEMKKICPLILPIVAISLSKKSRRKLQEGRHFFGPWWCVCLAKTKLTLIQNNDKRWSCDCLSSNCFSFTIIQ